MFHTELEENIAARNGFKGHHHKLEAS